MRIEEGGWYGYQVLGGRLLTEEGSRQIEGIRATNFRDQVGPES